MFSERSKTMMMTMSSDTAKKKVPMNFFNMYKSIFFTTGYNLRVILGNISSFHALKSPLTIWLRADLTSQR